MKTINGNLIKHALEGKFDVVIHGCNCSCTMGAGIAKSIKDQFPEAYQADLITINL
jgi:O-acetyl-ADP-ribose deacetylase (regulator of RNase III)